MENKNERLDTVAYTHLDVYKRQGMIFACCKMISFK